jgi:N-acyl-D-amino-acid deacylase
LLVLKADGKAVSGTITALNGRTVEILEGETDGKTVAFRARSPNGSRTVTFVGTVNGDEIEFIRTVQVRPGDDLGGQGIFGAPGSPPKMNAKRVADRATTPEWISPLTEAVWKGDVAGVKRLLAAGEDPDARDFQGFAPWRWAIVVGENEALTLLLEKIPVIRNDDLRGRRGLLTAAARNNLLAARELIKRAVPADVPAADGSGGTALLVAAASGYTDLVTLLLDAGADVRRQDAHGDTALMAAVRIGSIETVKLLLARGADVGQQDDAGRTAFLWAARSGRVDVARSLLEAGAKIDVADQTGRTPLTLAAENGGADVVDLLRAQGAKGSARAIRGTAITARAAVEKSLPLLQRGAATWLERRGCAACHHVPMIIRVTELARQRGFSLDNALAEAPLERLRELRVQPETERDPLRLGLALSGDQGFATSWQNSSLLEAGAPRNATRESFALFLARLQLADGRWRSGPPRVPIESSEFTTTASAARVLMAYGPPDQSSELRERIARAKRWLETSTPTTTDDKAYRLLGLQWTGSDQSMVREAADLLRREQNPDGGWSQLRGMNSDAYATGLVLVALHQTTGTPVADRVYTRGVAYLLRTQEADGSWLVTKRAEPGNNPYFESGFPHGKFQFISYAGTCWATMALIYAATPNRP